MSARIDTSIPVAIHWFRQDLRLTDNPGLCAAAAFGALLPVYILDDENAGDQRLGAAGRSWLHHSLNDLNKRLDGQLVVLKGDPQPLLEALITTHSVSAVFWNRCYEAWRMQRDARIKSALLARGLHVESFNGSLLWEPWQVCKKDGSAYRVFTPFYQKRCLQMPAPREAMAQPKRPGLLRSKPKANAIEALGLLPEVRWDSAVLAPWDIGERGANKALKVFITQSLSNYQLGRDFPALCAVSRLSPHLRFGELSPHQAWHAVRAAGDDRNVEHFCKELAWREFSYHLLYHYPDLPRQNFQNKFDNFPWIKNSAHLQAWQRGQTGYPIVDAGMRELWQTGYMHNRVRMIVGSFLVKNLLIDWRLGERWFWDCLLDADLASNSASWQWVAGSGADAAPFFRIFNPTTQGEKFDPDGVYIRRFVPEIAGLPNRYLFKPWDAPQTELDAAHISLGETYPLPIMDLKFSRERALNAFRGLSSAPAA